MARVKANDFSHAGKIVQNIVSRKNSRMFRSLWRNIVNDTPVDTGTARFSWILTAGSPSPRKPPYPVPKVVNFYGYPPEPPIEKYTYRWLNWYLVNNHEYVWEMNAGTAKANKHREYLEGYVDRHVRTHVILANTGGF